MGTVLEIVLWVLAGTGAVTLALLALAFGAGADDQASPPRGRRPGMDRLNAEQEDFEETLQRLRELELEAARRLLGLRRER